MKLNRDKKLFFFSINKMINPFLFTTTCVTGIIVALSIFNLYNDCKIIFAPDDTTVIVSDIVFVVVIITLLLVLLTFCKKLK
jgi:hypothetical protein